MVGGGRGAFIGGVHRRAANLDGNIELVAGAFSSDPKKSKLSGKDFHLDPTRVYSSYQEMAEKEKALPEDQKIDFVTIVVQNHLHFDVAKTFLQAGFNVICDKPVTYDLAQARELRKIINKTKKVFALTHNYTGYPMVKLAREMVKKGVMGHRFHQRRARHQPFPRQHVYHKDLLRRRRGLGALRRGLGRSGFGCRLLLRGFPLLPGASGCGAGHDGLPRKEGRLLGNGRGLRRGHSLSGEGRWSGLGFGLGSARRCREERIFRRGRQPGKGIVAWGGRFGCRQGGPGGDHPSAAIRQLAAGQVDFVIIAIGHNFNTQSEIYVAN